MRLATRARLRKGFITKLEMTPRAGRMRMTSFKKSGTALTMTRMMKMSR